MKNLAKLDENNATLRLLLILLHECPGNSRTELLQAAKSHGTGNTAFYKSLKTLIELELVKESKRENKLITTLTPKGLEIAQHIHKINENI